MGEIARKNEALEHLLRVQANGKCFSLRPHGGAGQSKARKRVSPRFRDVTGSA